MSAQEDSDSPLGYSDTGSIGGSQIISPSPSLSLAHRPATPTLTVPQSAPPTGQTPSFTPLHRRGNSGDVMTQSIDDDYPSDDSDGNYDRIDYHHSVDREQPMPLPKTTPTNPTQHRSSSDDPITINVPSSSSMKEEGVAWKKGGVASKEGGGAGKDREALSAAVSDLIKRCIFVGELTQDYHWPGEEFFVKVCILCDVAMETGLTMVLPVY